MPARIVCLMPVRNEAWMLDLTLRTASLWADDIVVSDQMSDDGSAEIAARYPKVRLIRYDTPVFNETAHRARIVEEARRIPGRKLLIGIDADEVFAPSILGSEAWRRALEAPVGTEITCRYVNLGARFETCSIAEPTRRPFGVIDDDAVPYAHENVFHSPRYPRPRSPTTLHVDDITLLHYQGVDPARMRSKHRWYQCFEVLRYPGKSPVSIYRPYHHMDGLAREALFAPDPAWLEGWSAHGIDARAVAFEEVFRWDREVLALMDEHGARRFEGVAIWDRDWVALARRLGRPEPARYADPRSPARRLVHAWLRATQPYFQRWKAVRAPDRVLRAMGY